MESTKVPSAMIHRDFAGVWMQMGMRSPRLAPGDELFVDLQVIVHARGKSCWSLNHRFEMEFTKEKFTHYKIFHFLGQVSVSLGKELKNT